MTQLVREASASMLSVRRTIELQPKMGMQKTSLLPF